MRYQAALRPDNKGFRIKQLAFQKFQRGRKAHLPSPTASSNPAFSIVALSAAFVSERRYLQNVSPKTLGWYKGSFKAFAPFIATVPDQTESRVAVKKAVMEMSEAGKLSPTSINDYARCINAFLIWMKDEGHLSERISIPKIKTPEKLPSLLSEQQVTVLI